MDNRIPPLANRCRALQRELAALNVKAKKYHRALNLAAYYLHPHTMYTEPQFVEDGADTPQTDTFPTLDQINSLIGEIGDKRNELFNVSDRLNQLTLRKVSLRKAREEWSNC